MSIYLRNSTTSQEVAIGPLVSSTDGNTEVSISSALALVWRQGQTGIITITAAGTQLTGASAGFCYVVMDEGHTGINGSGAIMWHGTGALPIRVNFTVLPQQVYDSMIAGTDLLQTDAVQLNNISMSVSYLFPSVVRVWDTISVSSSNVAVADFSTRLNVNVQQWKGASVSSSNVAVWSSISSANVTKWAGVSTSASNVALMDVGSLNNVSKNSISAVVFSTQMTESYAVTTSAMTLPQGLYMLWSFLQSFGIAGTTYTSKKLDKVSTAMTHSFDSAVTPSAITRET